MLQDCIELRKSLWVPRRDNNAPKTIAEIHEDAAKAKEEESFLRRTASSGGRGLPRMAEQLARGGSGRRDNRGDKTPGTPTGQSADGWSTVGGSSSASRKAGDLSKFGSLSRTKVGNLSLGPGGIASPFGSLAGGSKGWKTENKDKSGEEKGGTSMQRTASHSNSNMFSVLNNADTTSTSSNPAAERAKNIVETSEPAKMSPPAERRKLNLLPRGSTTGAVPLKSPISDTPPAIPLMTEEQANKKIEAMVQEYWAVVDVQEAIMCVKDLPVDFRPNAVKGFVDSAIEKKQDDVANAIKVLSKLRSDDIITAEGMKKGFASTTKNLDDLSVDVPAAFLYTAQLLYGAQVSMSDVSELLKAIPAEGIVPPSARLAVEYLKAMKADLGEEGVIRVVKEANFDFKSLFAAEQQNSAENLLDKNGLGALIK